MNRLRLIPALLILLLVAPAAAQQNRPLPSDSAVTIGTLPNGLRYYIRENRKPEARAELRLVVNAGSVLEDDDQRGLAHFVEHMAFNGTKNFEKHEIVDYLESIGMQFGADLNAYTSFDETVYMLTVPTDSGTFLEKGFQILEDWAHNISFDSLEVDKERGVVIEEWRLGLGADARMREKYFPVLFHESRYAQRLPIGERETLQNAPRSAIVRFYREWYRPDLMAVVAVGDFDRARVEALIRHHFTKIPAAKQSRERAEYPVPDHAQPLVSIATDPEATGTSVEIYHKLAPREQGTEADYRAGLVDYLYSAMLNFRLAEMTQQAAPPFINAGGGRGGMIRTKDVFSIGASVPETGIMKGLEALVTEAERAERHGFADSELEREKTSLLRYYETAYAERDKSESASYASEYVRSFLEDEATPGIAAEYELVKRLLPGITRAEVEAAGRAWQSDSNTVIVIQAPEKQGIVPPTPAQVLALVDSVKRRDIQPYVDRVVDGPLVENAPRAGRITSEKQHPAIAVTEWTLSNGARVLLKPTRFKDDEIIFAAHSPGGHSLASDDEHTSAIFASTLVNLAGIGRFDPIEFSRAMTGKMANVSPYIAEQREGFSGEASTRDVRTLFELIHLYFTAPRRDTVAFQSYVNRVRAIVANRDASPETAYFDTLTATLSQHHIRQRPLTPELLGELELDEALRFYQQRFADASDFTFVFVGNFTLDSIKPLVTEYIASLPSLQRKEHGRDTGIRPPAGVIEKTVRRGTEPKSQTQIVFTGEFDYTRMNRHALASLVAVLDIRLRELLREDLGGTYGVSIRHTVQNEPWPSYAVHIAFGAAPERLDSLAAQVFATIENLQKNGVSATDIAKVKETQRRDYERSLQENRFWAQQLLARDGNAEPLENVLTYPELVEALTPALVQDAAKRYLRRENHVRVSLTPETFGR